MLKSPKPDVRRLLGVEGDFGKGLGLSNDWAYRIIKAVGNYGEVVRAQRRHGFADQDQARPERAVDQRRPAIRAADSLRRRFDRISGRCLRVVAAVMALKRS